MKKILLAVLAAAAFCGASGQSRYDAHAAFAPLFYPHDGNRYRSASGAPGPGYWQNRADYAVSVTLDTAACRITGEVKITYTNNSPGSLSYVWLELDQNIDRSDSRASVMSHPGLPDNHLGFHIAHVMIVTGGKAEAVQPLVDGTRMQLRLPRPLAGRGGKLQMLISYDYVLQPSGGGGRSGWLDTGSGRIFEVSYWYPRMEVYDDLRGWNTLPFLGGGEFYMDYGDIDYRITLPAGMIVAGSGSLQNPAEVLTPLERSRLDAARHSEKTVVIRTPLEHAPATSRPASGRLTWHFHMRHTRDAAWAASSAFIWDAARIDLPQSRSALAMSVYPVESAGDSAWGRATEYLKGAVEIFSRQWFPYPYPVAINVAGKVGGMEFPGITFDWWKSRTKSLYALLSHEIGHNWFPMIVGSNERRYAWMDEGFNTFIDIYAQQLFHGGEYAPKRDGEYAPGGGNPADEVTGVITAAGMPPMVTRADAIPTRYVHPLEYFKTAFGLVLLREVVLGPGRFDYAFRRYIRDWAYRHPSPWDFFREMENGSGEDLCWFWRGWFLHNWRLDQAVTGVARTRNGTTVSLENLGKMPMPVIVRVTESDGKVRNLKLPVEIWERGSRAAFTVPDSARVTSVVLDPLKQLPDVNRANNTWRAR
jgi:hypothetical protein